MAGLVAFGHPDLKIHVRTAESQVIAPDAPITAFPTTNAERTSSIRTAKVERQGFAVVIKHLINQFAHGFGMSLVGPAYNHARRDVETDPLAGVEQILKSASPCAR